MDGNQHPHLTPLNARLLTGSAVLCGADCRFRAYNLSVALDWEDKEGDWTVL